MSTVAKKIAIIEAENTITKKFSKKLKIFLANNRTYVKVGIMTTVKMTLSGVMKHTGLKEAQIRYRIEQLEMKPEKLHERLFLFSEEDVKQIVNYSRTASAGKDAHLKEK